MAKQHNIPHVKNVDLVPESKSHGGARLWFTLRICPEPWIASWGFALLFTPCMISWNQVNQGAFVP
jgi:hypothetical protein